MAANKDVVVYPVRLSRELYERLDAKARAEHRTKADQIRYELDRATRVALSGNWPATAAKR